MAPADSGSSSTPWGWIVAAIAGVAAVVAAFIAMVRRSRRREAAERWRTRPADAYGQARLIDALLARDAVDSPDLRGRIAAARSEFFLLAALGPDLPSMQAASMAPSALDELDLALNAERAPSSQPGVAEPDRLTVGQARTA